MRFVTKHYWAEVPKIGCSRSGSYRFPRSTG